MARQCGLVPQTFPSVFGAITSISIVPFYFKLFFYKYILSMSTHFIISRLPFSDLQNVNEDLPRRAVASIT